MKLTYEQFKEYLIKNGITLAKTTEKFINIPAGNKLYFCSNGDYISTFDKNTNGLNRKFNYNFYYEWDKSWIKYQGLFEIEEEIKEVETIPTKIEYKGRTYVLESEE
jgi:YHS domain-containing protein